MDYSANINPLGLPEGVKRELLCCVEENVCCIYPDSACRSLKMALSEIHHVPKEWISCGNGAADLIFALVAALRPRHALLLAPSFLEYSQALHLWGCETDSFMLREDEDFSLDPFRLKEALFRARAEKQPYDILFLCNPNNPTGLPVKKEIVEEIGVVCKETGTWLAVDECFCDFLDEPEAYSVIPKLKDLDHVIVLKAFTKIYAMAGLRLGYSLCADQELNIRLETVRQPGLFPDRLRGPVLQHLKKGIIWKLQKGSLAGAGTDEGEACRAWLSGLSLPGQLYFFQRSCLEGRGFPL